MGIYIKGMEMPTDHHLWIIVHSDGTVEANEVSPSRPVGWQTLRNAAVPVPPHGRLIDADVLMQIIREHDYPLRAHFNSTDNGMFTIGIQQAVDEAPTIIPAEEGE